MGQSLLAGVVSGVSGAVSGSRFGVPGAIVLGSIGAVLGFAGSYLAKKEMSEQLSSVISGGDSEKKYSGYTVNSRGSALHHQIIYGKTKVGGVIVFDDATGLNNEYLSRIIAFAGHEVDDFEEIFLDNYKVTSLDSDGNVATVQEVDEQGNLIGSPSTRFSGLVKIRKVDGGHTTSLDGQSLSNFSGKWTSNHVLQGIAHLAIVFKADVPTDADDVSAYPNGLPVVTALIKGKQVYDPRSGSTAWSDNPALIIRDFLTNGSYGLDEDAINIDDDRIETAADICDENVTTDGSTRYTCNGAWLTSATPVDILSQLVATCAGTVWYAQGKWRLKGGAYTAPVLTLSEDDLRAPMTISTRHSRRDNYNGVQGLFKGPATNYQPTDYPLVTDPSFVTVDGGEKSVLDLPLPFTNTPGEAQRIANIALERNRSQVTLSGTFGLRAFQLEVGDIVALTNSRLGYTSEVFEVVHWSFGVGDDYGLNVDLVLRSITPTAYDEYADTAFESDNTDFPNPNANLVINSLTVAGSGKTLGDGSFVPNAIVSWSAPGNPFVTSYDVEWRQSSESTYSSTTTPETSVEIGPFVGGVSYFIRVRAVTQGGARGPFVTTSFTGGGDSTAPAAPTSVSATGEFKAIRVEWTNPTDLDFSHVEVYEYTSNNSGAASKIAESTGDHFYRTNLGLGDTKYFWLKAVDFSGNKSGFSSVVSATSENVGSSAFVNDVVTLFEDQDLYLIEDYATLPASGTTGQQVYNRADGKLYRWDGSSWEPLVGDVGDVDFADLSGTLADAQIAVGSINGTKITNQSIDSPQITAAAITAGKIATNAVSTNKIAANAITGAKIAGGTITGDKIVANTITGGLLSTSGIITNTAQINNSLITNAKIANSAISTAKIQNAAINNAKIANLSVDSGKLVQGAYVGSGNFWAESSASGDWNGNNGYGTFQSPTFGASANGDAFVLATAQVICVGTFFSSSSLSATLIIDGGAAVNSFDLGTNAGLAPLGTHVLMGGKANVSGSFKVKVGWAAYNIGTGRDVAVSVTVWRFLA